MKDHLLEAMRACLPSESIIPERVWIVDKPHELIVGPNPNYLNSLTVGVVSPVLNLPFHVFAWLTRPTFHGFVTLGVYPLISIFVGLIGRANGIRLRQVD